MPLFINDLHLRLQIYTKFCICKHFLVHYLQKNVFFSIFVMKDIYKTIMPLTAPEICDAISKDFKRRRITHQIAADKIGTPKHTITNQLSRKKRFGEKLAKKFSDAFGYSITWLLYGEGEMFSDGRGYITKDEVSNIPYFVGKFDALFNESRKIQVAERLLEILNNRIAISAFRAYLEGDYKEYETLRNKLEADYFCNIPLTIYKDPKATEALRKMRDFFTEAETEAAKELVLLEKRAASGEIIDVDVETERFRKKVKEIKEKHQKDSTRNQ